MRPWHNRYNLALQYPSKETLMIKEIVLFAYASEGEALMIANSNPGTAVAKVHIIQGMQPAPKAVCFLVVPENYPDSTPQRKVK